MLNTNKIVLYKNEILPPFYSKLKLIIFISWNFSVIIKKPGKSTIAQTEIHTKVHVTQWYIND